MSSPGQVPDFAWAFASRFLFLMAYALLTTYEAYYLLQKIGSAVADVPQQIFLGTLVQSVIIIAASLIGGHFSDRTGRRKVFVFTAAIAYGLGLFAIAIATNFNGFLVGMAISGLGFGVYAAVKIPRSSRMSCRIPRRTPRISACLTSRARCRFPSRLRARPPSWRSAAAVTKRSMQWPGVCAIVGAVAVLRVKGIR